MSQATFIVGDVFDVLASIPDQSVAAAITSVPYIGQRRYTNDPRELGAEPTLEEYVANLAAVFDLVKRKLRPDGTAWLNIGDKANGSGGAGGDWTPKRKRRRSGGGPTRFLDERYLPGGFIDAPGAVLRELLLRGWRLRLPIVWDKTREAPEDLHHVARPRSQHEMIYMLAPTDTRTRFFPDRLKETGSIWRFLPSATSYGHLAPFPTELVERCMLPTTEEGDTVLDPFAGSGTTLVVATGHGRDAIGIDLDERNADLARERVGMFLTVEGDEPRPTVDVSL